MKFIPYYDKIQIRVIEQDSMLKTDNQPFYEMGEVISTGRDVTFFKKGDTIFFSSWGFLKTPEVDGQQYYVIPEKSEFILGKYNGTPRK